MKNQASFSSKDKSKKLTSAAIFVTIWDNNLTEIYFDFKSKLLSILCNLNFQ